MVHLDKFFVTRFITVLAPNETAVNVSVNASRQRT